MPRDQFPDRPDGWPRPLGHVVFEIPNPALPALRKLVAYHGVREADGSKTWGPFPIEFDIPGDALKDLAACEEGDGITYGNEKDNPSIGGFEIKDTDDEFEI